ncbi:hypothetical protein DV736_g2989, partial [Chaetothyriales sp. CBS 134916]
MKAFASLIVAAAAAASLVTSAVAASSDFPSIVIKGSKFFYSNNGTQFFIKGVAYQQDYSGNGTESSSANYTDPLVSASNCQRDIPYLTKLSTNTIRVYAIDPEQNHDECMQALQTAGIYVIADLSAPNTSINRDTPTWNDDLYARYTSVIDVMVKYPNTLGFFAGNEVSNNASNTDASAFVKAAVRDMKAYIKQQAYRTVGVGYATNDDADIRENLANYFDCGQSADAIDFWGYNIYSWCGDSSYTESGYNVRTEEFEDYNVPVFFAEYGCNLVQPRKFTEVGALYGPNMSTVWSGGIVYMYFQEANDYGLVTVSGNTVSTLADFNYLSSEIATISPSGVNSADYNPTNTAAASCPSVGTEWQAASALPPTPNAQLCDCMYSALTCVPNDVSGDDVGDLFGIVCGLGKDVCAGITANATTGDYGAYGMCNSNQQLGWALNAYYDQQSASGNAASACDFSGSATTQSPTKPTGTCAALISQAGNNGQGTVTRFNSQSSMGILHAALFIALAFASGAGMILL